ncbi:stomatin-like [Sycon ciliatum]|uniref:stomatin-like n=1 Tax=Sycon ciliatum TaxID=27933 RepID=UPI0031F612EF
MASVGPGAVEVASGEEVQRRPAGAPKSGYHADMHQDSGAGSVACTLVLTFISYILVALFFPLSLAFTIKIVTEYQRVVILRLGRVIGGRAKGPGLFFILPCLDELKQVDLRTVVYDVPPQEILTKDSVTVTVDAVLYFRIFQPILSVTNVTDAGHSTWLLAQTTLRNVLGTKSLQELLSQREQISQEMQNILDEATDPWGVRVERVEVKDVRLPKQLQRAMAAEAEAAREARAKVIAAEGEQNASRGLKEAANIMNRSKGAMQLRYLQTLTSVAGEKNHTIMFPLPLDLVNRVLDSLGGGGARQ